MGTSTTDQPLWRKACALIMAVVLAVGLTPLPRGTAYADDLVAGGANLTAQDGEVTIDTVRAEIQGLKAEPRDYTAADKDAVLAVQAHYDSLSAEDQATLDAEESHPSDTQSLGRVLESAVWAVQSFDTDTSTTLANGTYTTTTTPAVSSVSDKGKSTSSRTRNWWVESVEVADGKAMATIYVTGGEATASKVTTYPSVWTGGVSYEKSEANTYTIPVDLNGPTYFGGVSSSMPRAIMYKLDTTIEEPAPGIPVTVTNNVKMFSVASAALVGDELWVTMGSDSFEKVALCKARKADDAEQYAITDRVVKLPVSGLGGGECITTAWWSKKNQEWYERDLTFDAEAKTLTIDPTVPTVEVIDKYGNVEALQAAITSGELVVTPELVDDMIAAIYVQARDEKTDYYCAATKVLWDALSDEQKDQVEEGDYFAADTGDASKDDPLNQDGIGEKEILAVSFGTSFNDSRAEDIGGIETELQAAYGEWSVRRAFTAQIIINHVQSRDGVKIDNMQQALDRAVANGVKELVVQPTHLMHGAEYDEMVAALAPYQDKMAITVAEPLLGEVGATAADINEDKLAVAEAVVCEANVSEDTALVLMGHGTAHEASITYEQMQTAMGQLGYENVFIGTVEGEPESTECSNVIAKVKAAGYKKVILRPLMVVAGDHANNDMADPEDPESWYSQFTASAAFDKVECQIAGLGRIEDVQALYVAHTLQAIPRGEQVIEAKDVTKTYGDKAFSLGATLKTGDGTLSYKSNDEKVVKVDATSGKVTIVGAGSTTITVSASETTAFKPASKDVKVTVKKADQVIDAKTTVSKTYGDKAFSLGAKLTKGDGKLTYKTSDKKVATVSAAGKVAIKGAGTAKITVSAAKTANYNAASKTVTVKVAKASQTVNGKSFAKKLTANKKTKKLAKTATIDVKKLGKVSAKTAVTFVKSGKVGGKSIVVAKTGKMTVKKGLKAGTYKVEVKLTAAKSANYNAATKTITVAVKIK